MATTVQTIQNLGDDRRRDSTSGSISTGKKLRAVISSMYEIRGFANWAFARRVKTIETFVEETDYDIVNTFGISDLSSPAEIRRPTDNTTQFEYIDYDDFDRRSGQGDSGDYFAIETRSFNDIMKIRFSSNKGQATIGDTSDHDANGTWAVGDDATNVTTDTKVYKTGGGSINFDIDVSASVNNYASISVGTTTTVDLSDYEDYGSIFCWADIPNVTYVTGFTLRVGSSASNYVEMTTTTNSILGSLITGTNRLKFNMNGATTTGTVDYTTIDYIYFRVTYSASQTDDTDFRLNGLVAKLPEELELVYYSSYLAKNAAGAWIAEPTATTDELIIPDRYREVVAHGYTADLLRQMGKLNESSIYEKKTQRGLQLMGQEFGIFKNNKVTSFKPRIPWPR